MLLLYFNFFDSVKLLRRLVDAFVDSGITAFPYLLQESVLFKKDV